LLVMLNLLILLGCARLPFRGGCGGKVQHRGAYMALQSEFEEDLAPPEEPDIVVPHVDNIS